MLFSIIDLGVGAIGIRLARKYRKMRNIPDAVFVRENLAFGGFTKYSELSKMKINSVIDLRLEVPDENAPNEIDYNKIGIPDGEVPTISQLDQIHKIIEEQLKQGKTLFIHCNLGRGRATLVTMSFLLRQGVDFEGALEMIKKRRFVYLNKKQFDFLENFSQKKDE